MTNQEVFDAIVVGAGFAGVQMLHELQQLGLSARGIEGGDDVGGAWYWNRYPGARCDVESFLYSYSFCPELDAQWTWSERYPLQPEIQRYIGFAADLWDVRKDIQFGRWVKSASWNEQHNVWTVVLDSGAQLSGTFLVMATGPLTTVVWPDIAGLENFAGELYHTARWPEGASLAGKRIGVIGNGSSGSQFMTEAAKTAGELHAFIRTPQYSVPAMNRPLTEQDLHRWEQERGQIRAEAHQGIVAGSGDCFADRSILSSTKRGADYSPDEQQRRLETYWNFGGAMLMRSFTDVVVDEHTNSLVADFVRSKVRSIVKDPVKRELLMPRHYAFGGKRIVVDTGFFEIFNQPNVYAHDLRSAPIARITKGGVLTDKGETMLDMLVFATGFDAATGTFAKIDIRGCGGRSLNDHWSEDVRSYLGITVNGFPNMLMVNGPGAPGPFSNVVISNEWCIEAIVSLIKQMRATGVDTVEADPEAEVEWMRQLRELAAPTYFAKTDNWYTGANVAGKASGIVNFINPALYRRKVQEELSKGFPHMRFGSAKTLSPVR